MDQEKSGKRKSSRLSKKSGNFYFAPKSGKGQEILKRVGIFKKCVTKFQEIEILLLIHNLHLFIDKKGGTIAKFLVFFLPRVF